MARALITTALLVVFAGAPSWPVLAQSQTPVQVRPGADLKGLQTRLRTRFDILPISNGVVLKPRFKTEVRSIEIASGAVAVDGAPATGAEIRQKLGDDADLILQISYLFDDATRRALLGLESPAPATATAVAEVRPDPSRMKRHDALVRVGGDVTVAEDEIVTDDVVVVGGSADINGQVLGDVAVVGGSLKLGPHANITKDVTVVGGTLSKDPNAVVIGKVAEVGVGGIPFGRGVFRRGARFANSGISPIVRFGGTIARVVLLMLVAGLVLLVARRPVEEIAERAAAEPVKSWLVGLLAEVLFVPVVVLTVLVLVVSIIGIPLLLLVPVAIIAALIVGMVGFTGIAYHLGMLLQGRFEPLRNRPYLATVTGIALIVSPLLLARILGLAGQLGVIGSVLIGIGVVAEYLAWTAGLGAAALVRFGKGRPAPAGPVPPAPAQIVAQ